MCVCVCVCVRVCGKNSLANVIHEYFVHTYSYIIHNLHEHRLTNTCVSGCIRCLDGYKGTQTVSHSYLYRAEQGRTFIQSQRL